MRTHQFKYYFITFLLFINITFAFSQESNKIIIVIIDGARYTETFGDPTHQYIPEMWQISQQGTIVDAYYNDGITYTIRAIPALWCGAWTEIIDTLYMGSSTIYAEKPTLFEYYRKQKNMPAEECFYTIKYINNLWLPSFDPSYGPDWWPTYHSYGSGDKDVAEQTQWVMDTYHPHLLYVYLGDTDHEGHSGIWGNYTSAIQTADSIVGVLWNKAQVDPFYKDQTILFVTNDHGRHDDEHGGFQHHGDECEGCRHIQFLAAGPKIKKNFISTQYRTIPDMAVTASYWLDIDPEAATGEIMYEIFEENAIGDGPSDLTADLLVHPNPTSDDLIVELLSDNEGEIIMFDYTGREVYNHVIENQSKIKINTSSFSSGIYFVLYKTVTGKTFSAKVVVVD